MARNTRYSPELRERAVTMVVEHRAEYPSEWATMTAIAGIDVEPDSVVVHVASED